MEIPAHKDSTKPRLVIQLSAPACSHFTSLLSMLCYPLPLDSFPSTISSHPEATKSSSPLQAIQYFESGLQGSFLDSAKFLFP